MVLSPSSLVSALNSDAPERLLEKNIEDKSGEIKKALDKGETFELKVGNNLVFMIKPEQAGK